MRRAAVVLGISVAACAFAMAGEREARACGGCFQPPTQTATDITDERMLLSVSPKQTTLYDQIRYSGNPKSFAWVLPIKGTVDVGLSADVLFDSVAVLTDTTITAPTVNCAPPPSNCAFPQSASGSANGGSAGDGVTVTKAENVGPYATVQLHATDSSALETWLSDNGFQIPADQKPIIDQYVKEGFDFLAMKLLPNQGVSSMRPVRVTSPGASLSLPLRMAAIGTGATVGITIWVVSEGRYEPQNFPFFHIDDKDLVWDFGTSSSNYTALRAQHATDSQNKGWEMEASLELNQTLIAGVINSGGRYYGGPNGGGGGGVAPPSDANQDYLPITTSVPDAGADSGTTESADQVRADDIKTLFAGMTGSNVRITRMRSDIAHAAMTTDFVLRASADQSEMSNIRVVTNTANATCPVYDGCQVIGSAPANADGSPAGGPTGSSGCAATSSTSTADLKYAGLVGILGLAAMTFVRRRRASATAKKSS